MNFINVNQIGNCIDFKGDWSTSHPLIFEYFKKMEKAGSYDSRFEQALALGCYALQTDQVARVLDKISTDLDGEIGILKKLIEIRGLRIATTQKGDEAEVDIVDVLQMFADKNGWGDSIIRTGGKTGSIPRNKIGDIVIELEGIDRRIAIESKLDGSVKLGDPSEKYANLEKKTAYGQSASALANRQADIAIFVGDIKQSDKSISQNSRVKFNPEIPGFVVVADTSIGDFSLVEAVYSLSRAIIFAWEDGVKRWETVDLIIGRVQNHVQRLNELQGNIDSIEKSAKDILKKVESMKIERDALTAEITDLKLKSDLLRKSPADALLKREIYLDLQGK